MVISHSVIIQVCKAPPPAPSTALHWSKVPGAPVLLQTDWGHAHRHLPDGDARSASPAHLEKLASLRSGCTPGIPTRHPMLGRWLFSLGLT